MLSLGQGKRAKYVQTVTLRLKIVTFCERTAAYPTNRDYGLPSCHRHMQQVVSHCGAASLCGVGRRTPDTMRAPRWFATFVLLLAHARPERGFTQPQCRMSEVGCAIEHSVAARLLSTARPLDYEQRFWIARTTSESWCRRFQPLPRWWRDTLLTRSSPPHWGRCASYTVFSAPL